MNGRVVSDPSHPVVPERARIQLDGDLAVRASWRTIILNKPRGTVTTRVDPDGRRTVFDVLGDEADSLVAVGRLDLATAGLLILTTDTQLANWLTDPANSVVRRYAVTVRGSLADESARVMVEGTDAGIAAHSVRIRKRSSRETHLIVELTEGRNREIRRLCESRGHEVTALKRIAFGGLELGNLAPGAWREVSREEIAAAFGASAGKRRR